MSKQSPKIKRFEFLNPTLFEQIRTQHVESVAWSEGARNQKFGPARIFVVLSDGDMISVENDMILFEDRTEIGRPEFAKCGTAERKIADSSDFLMRFNSETVTRKIVWPSLERNIEIECGFGIADTQGDAVLVFPSAQPAFFSILGTSGMCAGVELERNFFDYRME